MDTSKQALAEVRSRRRWTLEEKRRITQETLLGGTSVARIAQRYALNANQLFQWRKKYREGRLGSRVATKLLPVTITDDRQLEPEKVAESASASPPGGHRDCSAQRESAHYGSSGRGGFTDGDGVFAAMISLPAGTRIWIVAGVTDMRRGFVGLSGMVQTALQENPFGGHVYIFRGRRGDLIKVLWFDGDGLCLFAKRLEKGRFIWPQVTNGTVSLTPAQLSMLLEGIDWRRPVRTQTPQLAI